MRASFTSALVAAAAIVSLTLAAGSAEAGPWPHHHGGPGWVGPAVGFGILGGIIAAGAASQSCYRYTPVYDAWGNYIGRRAVNVCD